MAPNSNQAALAANQVNVENAAQSMSDASAAGIALIDNHFPAGSVPKARAQFVVAKAAADAQLALMLALNADQTEVEALS